MATIRAPEVVPSPPEDCEKLIKAFEGLGTDEKAIIRVLGQRNASQRKKIKETFQQIYNKSLIDCLDSELSGDFGVLIFLLVNIEQVLVRLVSSYRYDKEAVDSSIANTEAVILHDAIRTKNLDDDDLVWILSIRNIFQLRATFQCYKDNYGKSIDEDIRACGKGILESILKVVVWCIDSPERHFAEVVRASIVGLGTDEDSLTRAIVTRAEIDMMKVRGEFFNANKSSLDNAVIGDTSGHYKDFLMTLLGAKI
ncbi:annexin D3-like [Olea europaea var. sylvestris]|uniref:annexin D3-like n=1 Tax=Olea europaea var. sylvestris TaxID=158386 RepID=UPI000C1D55CB|nr:annexin D3-like [Olea europaea var. sylvestris]